MLFQHAYIVLTIIAMLDVGISIRILLTGERRNHGTLQAFRGTEGPRVSARVQKVKDLYVTKEIVNDLTASEFALIVDMRTKEDKIDYSMLISRLDRDAKRLDKRKNEGDQTLKDRILLMKSDLQKKFNGTSPLVSAATSSPSEVTKSEKEGIPSLRVLVREDGTIDWEDAIASSREVAKFGTELWERLNGKEEGVPSFSELLGRVPVKFQKTEQIVKLETLVNSSNIHLLSLQTERDGLKTRLRAARKANKSVASDELEVLRRLEFRVKEQDTRLKLLRLDMDMEEICVCLEQEVQSSTDPSDQKLILAQVALIERQFSNIMAGLPPLDTEYELDDQLSLSSLVDEDELALVLLEVNDLKIRLSIDSQSGRSVDWGTLGIFYRENLAKINEGFGFFGDGTKMIVTDLSYAWSLLVKAAQVCNFL